VIDFTNSTYSDAATEPCSLETVKQIMDWFADRMPAMAVSVSVHPDYIDLFKANLREEGFVRTTDVKGLMGLPVLVDPELKGACWRVNYNK